MDVCLSYLKSPETACFDPLRVPVRFSLWVGTYIAENPDNAIPICICQQSGTIVKNHILSASFIDSAYFFCSKYVTSLMNCITDGAVLPYKEVTYRPIV